MDTKQLVACYHEDKQAWAFHHPMLPTLINKPVYLNRESMVWQIWLLRATGWTVVEQDGTYYVIRKSQ